MRREEIPDNCEVVVNPYKADNSANRKGLLVRGEWSSKLTQFINENEIRALYLNSSMGWRGKDYSFLENIAGIEELQISASGGSGLSGIEAMSSLEELSITCASKDAVDFSKLTRLRRVFISWWSGASSIFLCNSLEDAYFDGLKVEDYSVLGQLSCLGRLTIGNSYIDDLSWLNGLNRLVEFQLLNCRKIRDFSPVGAMLSVKRLTMRGCKNIDDLNFLKGLQYLEVLIISDSGKIKSLKPISELKNLKAISFAGASTVVEDGDLSVLEKLPCLSMVMFQGRRHYTHKIIKEWSWNNFGCPGKLLERK